MQSQLEPMKTRGGARPGAGAKPSTIAGILRRHPEWEQAWRAEMRNMVFQELGGMLSYLSKVSRRRPRLSGSCAT